MIIISDLSSIKKLAASETALVVGGVFDFDSFNIKLSDVDITQANVNSAFSFNAVGSVNTFQ